MSDYRLTAHNFDTGGLRNSLRFQHGFEHEDLDRAKGVIGKAIEHVEHKTNSSSGMSEHHLEMAMKYFKNDPEGKLEWKKIPEFQRPHLEAALKEHFAGPEQEKKAA